MTGVPGSKPPLSPQVAELLGRVEAKVSETPTVGEIRELAKKAARDAKDNALTVAEIGELAKIAVDRAKKVDVLVARLAELVDEADHAT
jgi:hypothetical protein